MRLTNHPVAVDLAWNVESAAKVKPFIDAALDAFRFSRPIVLYVKYYLHVQGLRDPFHGGNGSYVLSMLVMLHLPQAGSRVMSTSFADSVFRTG